MEVKMNFKFEFTEDEANMVIQALQELPAKFANPLTAKIQKQAAEQLNDNKPVKAELVD
jgi:hypothetical protein